MKNGADLRKIWFKKGASLSKNGVTLRKFGVDFIVLKMVIILKWCQFKKKRCKEKIWCEFKKYFIP